MFVLHGGNTPGNTSTKACSLDLQLTFSILGIHVMVLTTFKAIHGTVPGYLCELVQIRKHSKYHLRSDDGLLLKHPSMKSLVTLGDRSFMFAAPSLWNRLPTDIRNCSSIEKFKAKLKTHFFSEAFDL